MEEFLMNALTGSVDTLDHWAAEMFTWSDDPAECQRQFNRLIEVVQDVNGDWVEAGQHHHCLRAAEYRHDLRVAPRNQLAARVGQPSTAIANNL